MKKDDVKKFAVVEIPKKDIHDNATEFSVVKIQKILHHNGLEKDQYIFPIENELYSGSYCKPIDDEFIFETKAEAQIKLAEINKNNE